MEPARANPTRAWRLAWGIAGWIAAAAPTAAQDPRGNLHVHVESDGTPPADAPLAQQGPDLEPVLDPRKFGTATVATRPELDRVPIARDPWAVLSTIPGITTDRVNVGGTESGEPANFVGHGDDGRNATWFLDGVELTDLGAIGTSPMQFDFNAFEEIGFVTGGAVVDQTHGGTRLSFVTQHGSNDLSANVRLFYTDSNLQSDVGGLSQPANVVIRPPGFFGPADPGNNLLPDPEVDQVFEKHLDVGGPLWRDHAWFWLGLGHNAIDNPTSADSPDGKELRNLTLKLHGQVDRRFDWKLLYAHGDTLQDGTGATAGRPPETTWDEDAPTSLFTAHGSYAFSPRFELSAQASHVDGNFSLDPRGGLDQQVIQDPNGIYHGSFVTYDTDRPQDQFAVRGTSVLGSGSWEHEVKYGYRYKSGDVESLSKWTSFDMFVYAGAYIYMYRERDFAVEIEQHRAWVGDTISRDNWAFHVGVHASLQSGENRTTTVDPAGICPTCLPGFAYPGSDDVFEWEDLSPRLGATYTFDTERRLLLRASYARFVDQLAADDVHYDNPAAAYVYVTHYWNNSPYNNPGADGRVDPGEFSTSCNTAFGNVDPCNTLAFGRLIDPNYEAPRTDELITGVEYELAPDFTVGASFTWRRRERERWLEGNLDDRPVRLSGPLYDVPHYAATGELRAIPASGYSCTTIAMGAFPDGTPYREPACFLSASGFALTDARLGTFLGNRPGYEQEYAGIELTATKRLSDRWMLRGFFHVGEWTQHFDDPAGISDPTNFQGGTTEQNGDVSRPSVGTGPKDGVWLGTSPWQLDVNGAYQLPRSWTLSAHLYGRAGYGIPYKDQVFTKDVQIGRIGDREYEDLWTFDLGVRKVIRLGAVTLELRGDVFNVLDESTVLSRKVRVDQPTNVDAITEVLGPRIFRLGASVNF